MKNSTAPARRRLIRRREAGSGCCWHGRGWRGGGQWKGSQGRWQAGGGGGMVAVLVGEKAGRSGGAAAALRRRGGATAGAGRRPRCCEGRTAACIAQQKRSGREWQMS